jgi:hypothetical protein
MVDDTFGPVSCSFASVHMHPDDMHGHLLPGSSHPYDHSLGMHGDDSLDSTGSGARGMGGYAYGASSGHEHDPMGELGESGGDLHHYHHHERDELDDSDMSQQ